MAVCYSIFASPLGELLAAGTKHAVTLITRDVDSFIKDSSCAVQAESGTIVSNAANAIRSYLHGAVTLIRLPYDAKGTAFQQAVWNELSCIPYGETRTYSQIADRIGKPLSFRAVANACGKNPVPLIIPCHRAVHKAGNAIGFAWGPDAKRMLHALEMGRRTQSLAA